MADYSIELTFETDMHKDMTISVPNANTNVDDTAVVAAARAILQSGCISGPAGEPVSLKKAELVAIARDDYDLT